MKVEILFEVKKRKFDSENDLQIIKLKSNSFRHCIFQVKFFGKETNLHSIWDTEIIERRIDQDFHAQPHLYLNYLLEQINTKYAQNVSDWIECSDSDESKYLACSTKWIAEDSQLNCDLVYRDENNQPMTPSKIFELGLIYYSTRLPILEQRLIQAGLRLGAVINQIVKTSNKFDEWNFLFIDNTFLLIIIMAQSIFIVCLLVIGLLVIRSRVRHSERSMSDHQKQYFSLA